MTQVGGHDHLLPAVPDNESNGLAGVMRNLEGFDGETVELEGPARLDVRLCLDIIPVYQPFIRGRSAENVGPEPPVQDPGPSCMVNVLMGNEYGLDLIRILAYLAQPAADLATGETGVYQESGFRVPECNAIAVTTAAKNAELEAYD